MIDDTCLTPFFQHVQFPLVQHIDIIKNVCLIMNVLCELPVCVALLVHHHFKTKFLICTTGNVWSIVYINDTCIYLSEIHACTIMKCKMVGNDKYVTLSWPLIYWWYSADNASRTPHTESLSWNLLQINECQHQF